MKVDIYIGSDKIDLYSSERITLKLSVTDIEDLGKINGDFSKDFTVPASKVNNNIFKHYYDIDINDGFDSRTKVNGRIDLSGLPWRYGKIRLEKVSLKSGVPDSYSIRFFSNIVDIKQLIRNDKLSELDLSAFDHDFTSDNVQVGLQLDLFSGNIVYTLNPKKQYFYSSDPANTTDEEKLTNISWNSSSNVHGVRYTDLSPSIRAIRILEAIESKYNLSFSRDFFGGSVFSDLYYALVSTTNALGEKTEIVDFDGGDSTWVDLSTDVFSFPVQSDPSVTFKLFFTVNQEPGYVGVPFDIIIEVDGEEALVQSGNFGRTAQILIETEGTATKEVVFKIRTNQEFSFNTSLIQARTTSSTRDFYTTTGSTQTINSTVQISQNIPEIKTIDWLTGIFKAYKLVVIPQEDGTLYVNTLNAYYGSGTLYDITKYVDFEKTFYERGDIFSEIDFSFEDPSTILAIQFAKNNAIAYGNEELRLENESGNQLDGRSYEVSVPFETVLNDRLQDQYTEELTRISYTPLVDEDINPVVPKSHFHYTEKDAIGTNGIKFVKESNVLQRLTGAYNAQTHSESINGIGDAFLFGVEFNEFSGVKMEDTLVKKYHLDYILGAFNKKRRVLKAKAFFPIVLLSKLNLNDVFKIRDKYWRPDNIEVDITTGEAQLTLLNTFENDLSSLTVGDLSFKADPKGQNIFVQTTVENPLVTLIDNGFGTSWVTTSLVNGNINITVDANNTQVFRNVKILVLDQNSIKPQQTIYISQDFLVSAITADNTTITADNTIITSDNG